MSQLTPIPGFINTSVTRSICVFSTIIVLSISVLETKHYVRLIIDPYIIEYMQYWRIAAYQLSVINESDYLLTILLWLQFKVLERFFGSKKYFSIVVMFAIYNALVCFLIMTIGQLVIYYIMYYFKALISHSDPSDIHYTTTILNEVASGALGILSSLYICYVTYIPVSYRFSILLTKPRVLQDQQLQTGENRSTSKELILSNRFPVHVLYCLLFLNNGFQSIIACSVGLVVGRLYTYDLLPGCKSWSAPTFLFKLFVNPVKKINSILNAIIRRVSGNYQPLNATSNIQVTTVQERGEERATEEPEDADDVLDEAQQRENQIRAENPVRPLGRQFLDTFRT